MIVSASETVSRPHGVSTVNPVPALIGVGSTAHTSNRYQGAPRSELWMPKTSHATVNSNGENPLDSATATLCCRRRPLALADFSRIEAILPLLHGRRTRHHGAMAGARSVGTVEGDIP